MNWGRFKPFWLSEGWKRSAEKQTGIFSWGETDILKGLDTWIPGLGSGLDTAADALTVGAESGIWDPDADNGGNEIKNTIKKAGQYANMASFASNNQLALYGLIGLVAYKTFFK